MSGDRTAPPRRRARRSLAALQERSETRFVIVGAACAGFYFLLLWALLLTPIGPAASGALAYLFVFLVAYRLQHGWTFRGGAPHRRALPRYAALQFTCALLSSVLATLLLHFGLSDPAAAALVTIGLSAFSFVMSRYWVFQHG